MLLSLIETAFTKIRLGGATGPQALSGSGSPDGLVSAPPGSIYLRSDTGAFFNKTGTASDTTGWVALGAGGNTGISGSAVITVPAGRRDWREVIAAPGVTASSKIMIGLAAGADDFTENQPDWLDVSDIAGRPGTNQITIIAAFGEPTSGPIPITWSAF